MIRPRELWLGFVLGFTIGSGLLWTERAAAAPVEGGMADDPDTIHCEWVCTW